MKILDLRERTFVHLYFTIHFRRGKYFLEFQDHLNGLEDNYIKVVEFVPNWKTGTIHVEVQVASHSVEFLKAQIRGFCRQRRITAQE